VAPVLGVLLNLAPAGYAVLVLSLALGTPALSMIGAFGAALTVWIKRGGLLMSLLVLPLYVPTLIFGAEAARRAAQGLDPATPLLFLAGITGGVLAVMPFAAGAVLRVNLR
jgi:heme exporter protein B